MLGRKDELKNVNLENVLKVANELDKTYDIQTKRYVESLLSCTKFLGKKESAAYLTKRRIKINDNISKLK